MLTTYNISMGNIDKDSTKNSIQFDDLSFDYSDSSSKKNDVNISQKNGTIGEEQCVQFYKDYAKVHDFVARCDQKGYDFNDNLNMRQMICDREGTQRKKYLEMENRKRDHRSITRIFLKIMGNKHPIAVVTDGDLAMRGAI
ncbi:hypothetical protein AHAS_Ahas20G0129300 [Arachis hypogaea]